MIIAALLIGAFIGTVSGGGALILGYSFWIALLTYTGIGALSGLATAFVIALHGARPNRVEPTVRRELSPLPRG